MNTSENIMPFVNRNVLALRTNTPAIKAAIAMSKRNFGSAIVFDEENKIAGIITDRDLTCNLLANEYPSETPISEIMSEPVYYLTSNATISDVLVLMLEQGIRRVPILENDTTHEHSCIGIVCLDDLISARCVSTEYLKEIVQTQIRKKQIRHAKNPNKSMERKEQTLNKYYNFIANYTELNKYDAEQLSKIILRAVVQRLPYTVAANFCSQLPTLLRDDLLDLPAGPNKYILINDIILDIMTHFQCDKHAAKKLAREFWNGQADFLNTLPEEVQILKQLPKDWVDLFIEEYNYPLSLFADLINIDLPS